MADNQVIHLIEKVFRSKGNINDQIQEALEKSVDYLEVTFALFILMNQDGTPGCTSFVSTKDENKKDRLNCINIQNDSFGSLQESVNSDQIEMFNNFGDIPNSIQDLFGDTSIYALILAPFIVEGSLRGIIIFADCKHSRKWDDEQIATIKLISEIFAAEYEKINLAEKLACSEDNFRTFFETVDDIIVVGNQEGRIVYGNTGACKKLGYSLNELIGKHILDLHPKEKRAEAGTILTEMFQGKRTCCPLELETKSGVIIPVETRIWFGKWNEQNCIFGVCKDLSSEQAALQKFERLFRHNPAPMAVSRVTDRVFVDVNEAFIEKFGYSRDEVIGKPSRSLGIIQDDHQWQEARNQLLNSGQIHNIEFEMVRKDGGRLVGLFSGEIISSQGEQFFLTVMHDITPQIVLQQKLKAEHARLNYMIEGTQLGTWEWDIISGETKFNSRWAEIIGYTLDELEPISIETWTNYCHPDDLQESERKLQDHFEGKSEYYECEVRMHHKDGSWVWVQDRGKVIEWNSESKPGKMYGTHAEITERKKLEEQIRDLSIRDPLTGLYNRRYIFQRLDEMVAGFSRKGVPFCMSILDIDHFKYVNDIYGHVAGDVVLRDLSNLLSESIRQYDLLGRLGGEEFIIVTSLATKSETEEMMERIRTIIREKVFDYDGNVINVTCSCGISESSEMDFTKVSSEELFKIADRRLYKAKNQGRDIVISVD